MIIAFIHNNKAFLPEIEAYCHFFTRYGITCEVVNKDDLGLMHRHVEWFLMGSDLSKPRDGIYKVHEYSSGSVPPWRRCKNWSKSFFNSQPDFRLFLNEAVKKMFRFHDRIPFGYRDMGVPEAWLAASSETAEKAYDFVYIGDLSPLREPSQFLDCFSTGTLKERSLLVLSTHYQKLKEAYAPYTNIHFAGPVAHAETAGWLRKARFGINFIPDKEPLNRQTSTKFLEYAATGLPIVTTTNTWMQQFRDTYGGRYFELSPDLSNFTWDEVSGFPYASPDLRPWTWEQQIRKSGIPEFLEARFPELAF